MSDESDRGSITTGHIRGTGIAIGHGARAEVHHHYPPPPPPQPKFLVPFPRNEHFVGRNDDLQRLHAALQKGEAVGVRPAMLSGMGGIGKTQLAVEYAYRFQSDYAGGVYWVNAAQDWQEELASLAERIGLRADDAPESQRRYRLVMAFADFLNEHPDALIIFDNVEDPRFLRTPSPGFIPSELKCRLLFTTRRRDPDLPFASIEVRVLPEMPALELLLDTAARRTIWQQVLVGVNNADTTAARAICKSLGYLPLALALASAYLGKFGKVSLEGYLKRLEQEGGLATVDASGADPLDLPTRHEAAVTSTLKSQWEALDNENARMVLQTAALLGEAAQIPRARLSLLTGLSDKGADGYPAPLDGALIMLRDLTLVEELTEREIRVHPLVRQFAEATVYDRSAFATSCATRVSIAYWDCSQLHYAAATRGIDAVLDDLRCAIAMTAGHPITSEKRNIQETLASLLRPLDLEAHNLRSWEPGQQPSFALQQLRNRCLELSLTELRTCTEAELAERRWPYLRERFAMRSTSEELVGSVAGHIGAVNDVTVAPDGHLAVSASEDGTLKVWDLTNGQVVRSLEGHAGSVNGVVITRDSHFAVSASSDQTLMVWELATGRPVRKLAGHTAPLNGVAITPDGSFAVSACDDGTLKVWDLTTGQVVHTLTGHTSPVYGVAITPNGSLVVSGDEDGLLVVWECTKWQSVHVLKGHADAVNDVAFTPDSRYAVSASDDRTLKIWELATGQVVKTLEGHTDWVHKVCVTRDGRFVVSASEDYTLKVWELATGQVVHPLVGHTDVVYSVAVTPDSRFAVSASEDGTLKVWDMTSGNVVRTLEGHANHVIDVAITPDGRFALSASDDGIRVWELSNGQVVRTLHGHNDSVRCVVATQDGCLAVSASDDHTLKVWDLQSGQAIRTLKGHTGVVNSAAVTSDGRFVISASDDCTLKIWDLATGRFISTLHGHIRSVFHALVTPDGRFVISASEDRTLKLWDIVSGHTIRTFEGHMSTVNCVAITADGRFAISASNDRTLKVWEMSSGKSIRTLRGHRGAVLSVRVTSTDRYAVSTSVDNTLRVWDIASGESILSLTANVSLWCCAVVPDESMIVVGDGMGTVHFIEWVR